MSAAYRPRPPRICRKSAEKPIDTPANALLCHWRHLGHSPRGNAAETAITAAVVAGGRFAYPHGGKAVQSPHRQHKR